MTPISRFLTRFLPSPLRVPALALLYAAMISAIVLTSRLDHPRIIYDDVRAR